MKFSKKSFIKKYGEQSFVLLLSFLYGEAPYMKNHNFDLWLCENMLSFEYECNRTLIVKERKSNIIQIIDYSAEDHGCPHHLSRFSIEIQDFLDIVNETDEILNTIKNERLL